MELRQLQYLVALADTGQFTRAAKQEHVAQPALSQQIKRLEEEVGTPLVRRSRLESTLTQAGTILVQRARRALAELDGASAELAELEGLYSGRIVIGAMQTLGLFDLIAVLSSYRSRYPGVDLLVREEVSGSLAELVRSGRLDLAFISLTSSIDEADLNLLPVARDEMVTILPSSHPLAGRERIALEELAEEQFISFSEGAALRQLLIDAGAESGFVPQITVESNEIPRIREMVSRGLGIALMPRSAASEAGSGLHVAALPGKRFEWQVNLIWRADRHLDPPTLAFLDLVRESAASEPSAGSQP